MTTPIEKYIAVLKASGLFDADWYLRTYPDVDALRMDPAEHYVKYGRAMGRMSAAGEMIDLSVLERLTELPAPKPGRALLEAHEICRSGDDSLGLAYARRHVPPELAYTIEALRANAALRRNDESGWLRHLNALLARFGAAPIQLKEGATLLDRLTTAPLPAVTGGPLISVIMTAWNAERTVTAAARSILNQTWRSLELLIVDDFSSDGTWGKLQEIAASDDRVKIFRNKINVGPYVSKNIMLSIARGAWITGHDSDDWAHPQRLEQHMPALQQHSALPRGSLTCMIRLEPDGMMDRIAPISSFSLDGATRVAPIACMFEQSFLREALGSWDTVRFGADSELIERSRLVLGDELKQLPLIAMLCMNLAGSLTNNPHFGVSRTNGPSQRRVQYAQAYTGWHKALSERSAADLHLPFPSTDNARAFEAPKEALIPVPAISRNFAAITGRDPATDEPVTAICASKRPWFASRVAGMMKAQTHRNLHLIYVAHGPSHDLEDLRKFFSGLRSVQILALPEAEQTLGAALNLALDHCTTDLCAKIDDDDFYGPNYIRTSLAALRYSGFDGVGIVGRERAYVYAEDMNAFGLRYPENRENALRSRVFGGTIFWSRKALGDQRFIDANTGEDSDFFQQAAKKGVKIFSAEPFDYVYVRYSSPGAHTWTIRSEDFMRNASILAEGIRLDLAYRSPHSSVPVAIPVKATA